MINHSAVAHRLVWALTAAGTTLFGMSLGWTQDHGAIAGKVVPLRAPDEKTIPNGPLGAAIRYGKKVLTETRTYAKGYVANGLNCSSCHLEAGRKAYASPWVGVWGRFPSIEAAMGR